MQIGTPRLSLRTQGADDAQMVADFLVRNRTFLKAWSPLTREEFFTEAYQRERLEREEKLTEAKSQLHLFLFLKEQPGLVIGELNFSNIVWGVFQSCHLGYNVDEHYEGKGYMREALQYAIAFLFEEWKLHRVEANIIPVNERSIRLVKALGFEEEGLAKNYLKINGEWRDHLRFAIRSKG
jgi:ribosomal-protein-alanine N-acetyltransferase